MKQGWHALFAPLPRDAVVNRKPVGEGAAIAGWQSLTVDLSAGDWVMYASEGPEGTTYIHENVGGRIEPDGSFRGTRWRSVTFARPDSDEAEVKESQHMPPSPEDAEAMRQLVREVLGR